MPPQVSQITDAMDDASRARRRYCTLGDVDCQVGQAWRFQAAQQFGEYLQESLTFRLAPVKVIAGNTDGGAVPMRGEAG